MHPDFALSAALRLPRCGEGRARPKVALAVRAAGFRRAPREASSLRAILEATGIAMWRSSLGGDRRTAFWPSGEAQNWRQALPRGARHFRRRDPDALDLDNQTLFSADPRFEN